MACPTTCPPLCPESVAAAHRRISQYVRRTPLLTSRSLDEIASSANRTEQQKSNAKGEADVEAGRDGVPGFRLYFKAEMQQRMGAFKVRGAFHALLRLIDTVGLVQLRETGVVTHSSGNHAQALAYAASVFAVPAYIVMPSNTVKSKVAGARRYATEIVFAKGSTITEREEAMLAVQARTNAIFVPPFDHADIVLGQGTLGLEIEQQFTDILRSSTEKGTTEGDTEVDKLDAVVVPLGGGGLLAGVATWFGDQPGTMVFGAEPSFQGADDGKRGREQGGTRIETVKSLTVADGLRMPVGLVNWKVVSDATKVQEIYSVSESEILMAMRLVFERLKVVAEPSACVPLAVILFNQYFRSMVAEMQRQQGRKNWHVGVVLSGGNTTMEKISTLFSDLVQSG